MAVVINDFEVVDEAPQTPQQTTPQTLPPQSKELSRIDLERTLANVLARLERVRAD
jgi:hypothetical protein